MVWKSPPPRASRPYDVRREGFVPAHGGAALVVESLESATRRGARIYAEVLGVEANSDANHLPQPSEEGQLAVMTKLLDRCRVAPGDIDFISAHATSTPLGDLTEIRSIKRLIGAHGDAGRRLAIARRVEPHHLPGARRRLLGPEAPGALEEVEEGRVDRGLLGGEAGAGLHAEVEHRERQVRAGRRRDAARAPHVHARLGARLTTHRHLGAA
jgi:hypothetical protein